MITDNPNDRFEGCEVASSIHEAMNLCDENRENFIIGGASVYRQFLPYASRLYLTRVDKTLEADTFFPDINYGEWRVISHEVPENREEQELVYDFIVLQRKD